MRRSKSMWCVAVMQRSVGRPGSRNRLREYVFKCSRRLALLQTCCRLAVRIRSMNTRKAENAGTKDGFKEEIEI